MKKIKTFIVTKLARQVEGDYIFIQVEKACNRLSVIDEYMKTPFTPTEIIQTPSGGISCVCERGVIELELDLYEDGE